KVDIGEFPQPFAEMLEKEMKVRKLFDSQYGMPFEQELILLLGKDAFLKQNAAAVRGLLEDLQASTRFYLEKPRFDHRVKAGNLFYQAWYNQGLRAIDISNPFRPREVGYYLARFQHQCAGPEGSSHARALSRLGLGSDLRHRRQWWRLDRAPLYGTAASEAADSWCPVKTARQISKLFAHDIALSNIIRGVKEVREWLPQAPLLICDCIPPLTTPSKSNNRRAEPISGSSSYWPEWARHDDLLGQREHECEAIRVQGR